MKKINKVERFYKKAKVKKKKINETKYFCR